MTINHVNYWPFDDSQSQLRFRELMRKLMESQGVAFFGAGTSMTLGFPSWPAFHREFLEQFDAEPGQVSNAQAMLIDFDYHINRNPGKALGIVKCRFAAPVPQIPPVITAAVTSRSLHYFYTTNFDEVLFDAAGGESVAEYPEYKPMEARFVYLHGRAATANSIHNDLVLGKTGYDVAYSSSIGSPASDKLSILAPYPVIFIGFSMNDPAVRKSLDNIAAAVRFRRRTLSNGETEEIIVPLNFYIALKAPTSTASDRDSEKESTEAQLNVIGVEVIWYQDGGEPDRHHNLLKLMQQIKERVEV